MMFTEAYDLFINLFIVFKSILNFVNIAAKAIYKNFKVNEHAYMHLLYWLKVEKITEANKKAVSWTFKM